MENNSNSKERQKEVQKLTFIVLAVMTVLIIGYAAYGLITESISMRLFGIMLGGFVVVYIVLTDIVEPFRLGLFQDLARERRAGFLKMMLMDVIGAGALIYWIAGLGSESGNDILIPFLIYFLTVQIKRKYRAEFEGTVPEEKEEPDTEDAGSGEQDEK